MNILTKITRQTTSMTQRMTTVTWLTPSKLAPMGLNGKPKNMHMLIMQLASNNIQTFKAHVS